MPIQIEEVKSGGVSNWLVAIAAIAGVVIAYWAYKQGKVSAGAADETVAGADLGGTTNSPSSAWSGNDYAGGSSENLTALKAEWFARGYNEAGMVAAPTAADVSGRLKNGATPVDMGNGLTFVPAEASYLDVKMKAMDRTFRTGTAARAGLR